MGSQVRGTKDAVHKILRRLGEIQTISAGQCETLREGLVEWDNALAVKETRIVGWSQNQRGRSLVTRV